MYYRDSKGRFSKKKVFWTIVICGLVYAIMLLVAIENEIKISNIPVNQVINQVNAELPVREIYEAKIRTIKEDMLKELSLGCETKGVKEPDGAILLDANNKMSIGRYMFQIDTVIHYTKKFEGRTITRREAIEIAVNPDRAGKLAERILFEENDGWKNWLICSNKMGLPQEISILNKLTK